MKLILTILLDPSRTAQAIRVRPEWVQAFMILAMTSIVVMMATHSIDVVQTINHLPPSATDADKQEVAQWLDSELLIRCFVLPIRLLLGWSTFALLLHLTGRAIQPESRARCVHFLTLEVAAETILLLLGIVSAVGTLLSGTPGTVPLSLGTLVSPEENFVLRTLLNSLNVFTLWYLVVLVLGVQGLCDCRRGKAVLIVAVVWGSFLAFHVTILKALRDSLHLSV